VMNVEPLVIEHHGSPVGSVAAVANVPGTGTGTFAGRLSVGEQEDAPWSVTGGGHLRGVRSASANRGPPRQVGRAPPTRARGRTHAVPSSGGWNRSTSTPQPMATTPRGRPRPPTRSSLARLRRRRSTGPGSQPPGRSRRRRARWK
jgi:hypothetical protein